MIVSAWRLVIHNNIRMYYVQVASPSGCVSTEHHERNVEKARMETITH